MTNADLLPIAQAVHGRCDHLPADQRRVATALALVLGDGDPALLAGLCDHSLPAAPLCGEPACLAEWLAGVSEEDGRLVVGRGRRRGLGAYYTPRWLVSHVADQTAPEGLRVLDPACGAGAFLVECRRRGAARVVGVDGDPVAVLAARRGLVADGLGVAEAVAAVRLGDGLLDERLHDAFDLVIGNPPWGLAFDLAYRRRLAAARLLDPGEPSSEAAFVRAAWRQVTADGRVAFVLPESWLSTRRGEPLRRWLIEATWIERLEVYRKGVFPGARDMVPVLLMLRRALVAGKTTVAWHGLDQPLSTTGAWRSVRHLDATVWQAEPGAVFVVGEDQALPCVGARLDGVASLHDGFYKSHLALGDTGQPVLTAARQVQPFALAPTAHLARVEPATLPPAELARQRRPKLLVHAMRKPALPQRVVAAADHHGDYLASNNLLLVIPNESCPWSLAALAALLNSGPVNRWYAARYIQVNIEAFTLGSVPLPPWSAEADAALAAARGEALDTLVLGLYGARWERSGV